MNRTNQLFLSAITFTLHIALSFAPLVGIAADKEPAFVSLFDSKSFTGWKHGGNWVIEDGAFFRKKSGGPLTYTNALVPDDFELHALVAQVILNHRPPSLKATCRPLLSIAYPALGLGSILFPRQATVAWTMAGMHNGS